MLVRHTHKTEGFPKLEVSFLGVLIIRTIAYWALYRAPPIGGNDQIMFMAIRVRV